MADETMQFRWAGMAPQTTPNVGAPVPQQGAMLDTDRQKLVQELQANEAKIAELKQKLSNARTDMDARDMRLAANRAGVGDIASSMAHQRNIEDRAYRTASEERTRMERERQAKIDSEYNKKKIVNELSEVNLALVDPAVTNQQKAVLNLRRNRLLKELGEIDQNAVSEMGVVQDENLDYEPWQEWTAEEWDKFAARNTDENGVWKNKDAYEWYLKNRPERSVAEINAKKDAEAKGNAEDNDAKKKAAAAAAKRKTIDAIDEAIKNYSAWNLKDGETKTYTAKNGLTVTVTRINGKKRYAIGKEFKER